MRVIDYDKLDANIDEMINALEYDSMRSGGKCKINATTLVELYKLKEIYELAAAKKAAPKKAATKAAE